MAKIKGRDTGPEQALAMALQELGLNWESHARDLPGRPDFVFREVQIVVFVDGDFWHGFRFQNWRDKLSEAWEAKIAANRRRDRKNSKTLRSAGWRVIRIWEHEVEVHPARVARKVARVIQQHQARNSLGLEEMNLVAMPNGAKDS
jgi:DNA mismatch endonuclease (patch repair protein)